MMDVRAIRTGEDYEWALREVEQYFDDVPEPGTPEADRFDVLSALIERYEMQEFGVPDADPVEVLEFAMESMGRTQAQLGHLITRSRATEVMKRRRKLTLEMIRTISGAWNIPVAALVAAYPIRGDHRRGRDRQRHPKARKLRVA